MKKFNYFAAIFVLLMLFFACNKNEIQPISNQAELKSNTLLTGVDEWGFNYQAQLFDGYLINAIFGDPAFAEMEHYKTMVYKGEGPEFWEQVIKKYDYFGFLMLPELLDCKLKMKWNTDLLGKDGIYPETWVDSDAWIVFHYTMNTKDQKWSQVRKLVARNSNYELIDGFWYNEEGKEVGKQSYYWPDLMIIQVINTGDNPFVPMALPDDYINPNGSGVGKYKMK
nr:hypothetical protein [uncultured Carboxylicivirga sp.]